MALPKWAGRNNKIGPYRLRVFWFRIWMVAGMIGAGSIMQARIQNDSEADMITSLMRHSLKLTRGEKASNIEEMPVLPSRSRQLAKQAKGLVANESLRETLKTKRISIHFSQTPFLEAIQSLREKTGLNIVVSEDARQLIRSESLQVSLRLTGISIKNSIQLILSSHHHLEYSLEDGIIYVSQGGLEAADLVTRFYNVSDITNPPAGVRLSHETLRNLLEYKIVKEEVKEKSLQFADNVLYCRLSERGQTSVVHFLETLRAHQRKMVQAGRGFDDPWWSIYGPESRREPAWVDQIHETLASTMVSFYFRKAPLAKIMAFFGEKSGLQFVIAPEIDLGDFEIDLRLKQVSLDVALKHTLKKAELSYRLRNNVIYIARKGSDDQALTLDFIGIQDIIEKGKEDTKVESTGQTLNFGSYYPSDEPYCVEQLLDIIRADTNPDSWDEPAFIQYHDGQLIIFQSEDKIHKTREIIARLRKAKQSER